MLNKQLYESYLKVLSEIQKDFPSVQGTQNIYPPDTINFYYDQLVEEEITDIEFCEVLGRIIFHLYNCTCHIIPSEDMEYKKALSSLDSKNNYEKEQYAKALIADVNLGSYEWFKKYEGTKTIVIYAHFHQHLKALRNNLPFDFCPFKETRQ